MKGRRIIPAVLQDKALKQLHLNHIGLEMTRLLAHDPHFGSTWMMIGEMVKHYSNCLDFQATWPKDMTISHKIPGQSESVGTDIFTINNKLYFCFMDYHSKFLIIKQVEKFSADHLIRCKIIFSKYITNSNTENSQWLF